mgnify:FL=1|jgi:hypothetical protein
MSPILFSQNDKPVAVFDDKKLFKSKSFHYILDILIKQGYFKTKKQCGMKIKEDLKLLFEEDDYTFIYKDIKFSKQIFEMNELVIVKEEKCVLDNVIYVYYSLEDINKPIDMIDVADLYNKNE